MFLLTAVLLCVLALAQAVPMDPVRLVVNPHITSPTESTVWHPSDQVTVTWDTSIIPAEGNFPVMLVLGHPEDDSENLDVNHPLAQDFSLRASSVEFTVPDVKPMSNYIVVLFGDSGNASPPFTIENPSTLVKRAPQEAPAPDPVPPPDLPDPEPTEPEPTEPEPTEPDPTEPDPETVPQPPATPPGAPATNTTSPSSTTSSTTSSRSSPTSSGGANGALSFAQHAHHTGTIGLCAAVAAMSLMFVM
ncbi:hypothetical protein BC826DRAFT_1032883 [Russula brevipes]|nr:hypothetical protein BC826DRAFT_1032883 [Russula brevipes]